MARRPEIVASILAVLVLLCAGLFHFYGGFERGVSVKAELVARGKTTPIRPWAEASEVRLFVEDLSYEEQARSGATMSNSKGVALTPAQRSILDRSVKLYRMTSKEYANNAIPGCFIPHHFFRYYDKAGQQLGELAVCYCCGGIDFSPQIRSMRADEEWIFDFDAIGSMLKEMGVPTGVNC